MADILSQLIPRAAIAEQQEDPTTKAKVLNTTLPWSIFFRTLRQDLNQAARSVSPNPVTKTDQNASIATTDLLVPVASVNALYSFQYAVAITIADGVSSSLTPVLSWTDGGVVKTQTFTAVTGNTTTTIGSGVWMFRGDAGAPITYATTYASNTPGSMHYDFYAVLSTVAGVP